MGLDFPAEDSDLPYRQELAACFAERIGPHGLARADHERLLAASAPAIAELRAWRQAGHPILALPERRDDLAVIEDAAARLRASGAELVVLGTGGSSLGGQTLAALADQGFGPRPGAPRLHFLDNVDPARFAALFQALDLRRAGILAISKSGGTPETLAQLLVVFAALRASLGEAAAARRVTVVTEPGDNPLRALAARFGFAALDHDPGLGGRYSVLSLVGLLPARVAGLDILALREGAAAVIRALLSAAAPGDVPPAAGAALAVALQRSRGIATTVVMPYADRLAAFGAWFRQLWAESLGKGGQGTTPARALGTVDQHSQLQLYLDGPADKLFTLIVAPQAGEGRRIEPALAGDPRLAYLAGRTMGDLLAAEQRATYDTLAAAGRPVRLIALKSIDERSLGALLMHFMLETLIAARLMGVDPLDQPAVEDGKRRARAYLAGTAGAPAP
jgi:glucose-6-phosphate isomerase